jgi:hypothetical protein
MERRLSSCLYEISPSDPTFLRPLPLQGVNIVVDIVQFIAKVQVVQFYVNDSPGPREIDCLYQFPLHFNETLCGFEYELSDRIVFGDIKKDSDARIEFDKPCFVENLISILTENDPNVMTQAFGNVPPMS